MTKKIVFGSPHFATATLSAPEQGTWRELRKTTNIQPANQRDSVKNEGIIICRCKKKKKSLALIYVVMMTAAALMMPFTV